MSEDRHDEKTPESGEQQAGRREFLKKAGVAAGALAMAGLGATAEAADIRLKPRMGPVLQVPPGRFQLQLANSTQQYLEIFQSQNLKDNLNEDGLAKLTPEGQVAGVAIFELSRRQQALPDVGKNIAVLFTMLANGMAKAANSTNPALTGDIRAAGNGCGNQCGYGCMSALAGGFICGNNCIVGPAMRGGTVEVRGAGQVANGFICGNNCSGAGLEGLTIDPAGELLGEVKFDGLNMDAVAGAMRNAAQAYGQVYG